MKVFVRNTPATPYWCALWLTVTTSIILWWRAQQRQRLAGDRWPVGSDGCSLAGGDGSMGCISSSSPINPILEVVLPTLVIGVVLFLAVFAVTTVVGYLRNRLQVKERTVLL